MKLAIAGGFYREICREPSWNDTFGPGGRASAALSGRGTEIELYCYVGQGQEQDMRFFGGTFGVDVRSSASGAPVCFHYLHFLSVPHISPNPQSIVCQPPLQILSDVVLRYGFLEGDAVVRGRRVVYDPQDAFSPKPFRANGSTADELTIIANSKEASLLTGLHEPEEMGIALLKAEQANVVVIKLASGGALVTTSEKSERIGAHPTETVWKIGSGDVFSAEYTYAWAIQNKDPFTAVHQASLQTAFYCAFPVLPIRENIKKEDLPTFVVPNLPRSSERKYDAYLASPFFNLSQQWQLEETLSFLQRFGLKVFSPFHAIGDGLPKVVAPADLQGLRDSRFVFACLDGFDPGTVFEVGYAISQNIPVICYGRDLPTSDLVMFEGTDCEVISDFTSAIYRASWWAATA